MCRNAWQGTSVECTRGLKAFRVLLKNFGGKKITLNGIHNKSRSSGFYGRRVFSLEMVRRVLNKDKGQPVGENVGID